MRSAKKIISLIIAVAVFLGVFVTPGYAAPKFSGKQLDIEVEGSDVLINGELDVLRGEAISNKGGVTTKPGAGEPGGVSFEFRVSSEGSYDVWALINPLSENKKVWVSIDEGEYSSVNVFPVKNAYYYTKIATVTTTKAKTFKVDMTAQVGWYTLDKFTITKSGDSLKNPDGTKAGDSAIIEKYNAEKDAAEAEKLANKKYAEIIPVFDMKGKSIVFDVAETGLSEWWSEKEIDSIKGQYILNGSATKPDSSARGDLEFDINATDGTDVYFLWVYANPVSTSKSAWVNTGSGYVSTVVSDNKQNEWHWVRIGKISLKKGTKTAIKIVPKNGSFTFAKFAVVKGEKLIPEGEKGKVVEKEVDTSVVYPAPPVYPPKGVHPRVMFTAEDIPQIKENMAYEGNAAALERYKINLASTTDGTLAPVDSGTNFNGEILNIIQSRAFEYAINGNEEMGKSAVESMKNYLNTILFDYSNDSSYNNFGEVQYAAACVYDWCYKFLTEEDMIFFRDKSLEFATNKIGYPPTKLGSITSHGNESPLLRDLLSTGIAMYDEFPYIYENAAGRLYAEFVPGKNFLYSSHTGAMQGAHYLDYREKWSCYALYLMDAIGAPNVFGDDMEYLTYWLMYARLPNGTTLNDGDAGNGQYYVSYYTYPVLQMMAANYYENPMLKWEFLRQQTEVVPAFSSNQSMNPTTMFIVNHKFKTKSQYTMPLSHYFGSPKGAYIARTSWDEGYNSSAVVAEFEINEYWTSNHTHLDSGAFQIYYKGNLAVDAGYYKAINNVDVGGSSYMSEHWKNYHTRSIAHNTMLVKDPLESQPAGYINDGGQEVKNNRVEFKTLDILLSEQADANVGKVLGHEVGTDTFEPNYTYLKGDITNAYSEKVEDYQRSFMFLNLKNDEHPAALLVFDHVTSANPDFEKAFVLNTTYKPEINGTRLVAKDERKFDEANKYNGKLTMDTLLPKADNVKYETFVGLDKYAYAGDKDIHAIAGAHTEGNGPRTEVSPKKAAKEDYFLNVIQVGDADGAEALPTTLIESETHYGAVVADRVVMFAKNKDKVGGKVSFVVANEGSFEFTVAGLEAGTWNVLCNGAQIGEAKVTEEGTVATFNGTNGSYTLSKVSDDANKQFTNNVPAEWEYIGIRINNRFLYSDVPAFIENGRTLVPLRAIFEGVGATVSWDAATSTATGTKGNVTVQITDGSNVAKVNGEEVTLDVAANTYNGRFMVPVRFIAESLGCTVKWRAEAQIVDISAEVKTHNPPRELKYTNEIEIVSVDAPVNAADPSTSPYSMLDDNLNTYYALSGTDGVNTWFNFDLGKSYAIDKVSIAFHSGAQRTTTFAIEVSEDGVNYTPVTDKLTSSGTTVQPEDFDLGGVTARFVKIRGFGNSKNAWNSLSEVYVIQKK